MAETLKREMIVESFLPSDYVKYVEGAVNAAIVHDFFDLIELGNSYTIRVDESDEFDERYQAVRHTVTLKYDETICCRDCIHWKTWGDEVLDDFLYWCGRHRHYCKSSQSCSWGERMER